MFPYRFIFHDWFRAKSRSDRSEACTVLMRDGGMITNGVQIGDRVVIGAGSAVTHSQNYVLSGPLPTKKGVDQ